MDDPLHSPRDVLDLLDWKRRIFDLYGQVRRAQDAKAGWRLWRDVRDEMFRRHQQSPLPPAERDGFQGLGYFEYDPAARVLAEVEEAEPATYEIATSRAGAYRFTRFAMARFELRGRHAGLELYWLEGYGGGVFLPFRDASSGRSTYGAGRYLLDTVKGADLGTEGSRLVLDFNFSYNPSCAYDPRWACPLAPPENRLTMSVEAGERRA